MSNLLLFHVWDAISMMYYFKIFIIRYFYWSYIEHRILNKSISLNLYKFLEVVLWFIIICVNSSVSFGKKYLFVFTQKIVSWFSTPAHHTHQGLQKSIIIVATYSFSALQEAFNLSLLMMLVAAFFLLSLCFFHSTIFRLRIFSSSVFLLFC